MILTSFKTFGGGDEDTADHSSEEVRLQRHIHTIVSSAQYHLQPFEHNYDHYCGYHAGTDRVLLHGRLMRSDASSSLQECNLHSGVICTDGTGQIFLRRSIRSFQKLGLLDTIPALFLPNLFSAFGTFLLRQFFMSLPKELEEAAIVDGCGRFRIFAQIVLPLIKPGIVAMSIFTIKFCME